MTAGILNKRKLIVITFLVLSIISAVVQFVVPVQHDMVEYMPENNPSIEATEVMDEEFSGKMTNARVMMKDISIPDALGFKDKLDAVDGVSEVTWLDDAIDMKTPIEMADPDTVETYYKDGNALYSFHVEEGKEVETTDAVYELIGEENAMSGEAVNTARSQKMTTQETMNAAMILVPIIILILLLSTRSWIERSEEHTSELQSRFDLVCRL